MALQYLPLGPVGAPYPEWVRDLRDRSGVYVIREGRQVVYVGESHTDRLYGTLTRHFQRWKRAKKHWVGSHYDKGRLFNPRGAPGMAYDRAAVTVAVIVTRPDRAIDLQYRTIRKLRPRDNEFDGESTEDIPF